MVGLQRRVWSAKLKQDHDFLSSSRLGLLYDMHAGNCFIPINDRASITIPAHLLVGTGKCPWSGPEILSTTSGPLHPGRNAWRHSNLRRQTIILETNDTEFRSEITSNLLKLTQITFSQQMKNPTRRSYDNMHTLAKSVYVIGHMVPANHVLADDTHIVAKGRHHALWLRC